MTSKNNRAPALCLFKFYALLHSHRWIQIGVKPETLNSGQNQWFVCPLWLWNLTDDLEKHREPLQCYFKLCASFRSHLYILTGVTVWKCPNLGKNCFDLCDLDLWPLTLRFCMDITSVNCNTFHDDRMTVTQRKRCGGQTDRRTETFIELLGRS